MQAYNLSDLVKNARHSMRLAQDKAAAHLQFACMFNTAGMLDEANSRLDKSRAEMQMADLYQAILFSLLSEESI